VAGFVRTLPDRALLDRIVRGRLWIPLLGVLLVGIVAMQVEVLKLNAGIGRAMIRTASLQTQNQRLRDTVSQQADPHRLMTAAAEEGMHVPAPSQPKFLPHATGSQLARALANIHPPDPSGFAQRTAATAAAKAASVTSEPQ
jgi:cell division protein FtsL